MSGIGRRTRTAGIGILLATAVLVAGGCATSDEPERQVATVEPVGGGQTSGSGNPEGESRGGDPVAYAKCMRENGVPNFPDPDQNGQVQLDPNSGVDQESPEFRKGQEACKQYLGSAAKVREDAASQWSVDDKIKYADCMRKNGLPSFPDPDKNGQMVLPRSLDPESEQFKAAESACSEFGPQNMPRGGGGAPQGGPAPGGGS
jgi:hypothetical protein